MKCIVDRNREEFEGNQNQQLKKKIRKPGEKYLKRYKKN